MNNPLGYIDGTMATRQIKKLHAAFYSFKDPKSYGSGIHVGLYAQDVEKMDPRCAVYDKHHEMQNYDPACVIALMFQVRTLWYAIVALLLVSAPALASNNYANITTVPSIVALQNLGSASQQYGTVNVQSYIAGGNAGGGIFVWNNTSTTTVDACVVFAASGVTTGRWFRQLSGASIDLSQCGAVADDTTDNAGAITAAYASALANKKDLTCSGIFKVSTGISLTPSNAAGISLHGSGSSVAADSASAQNGNCTFDGTGITTGTGFVFDFLTPFPGFGTTSVAAPRFYDINVFPSLVANIGGCIRFNQIAGGFTDDASSQESLIKPVVQRVFCTNNNTSNTVQIGIQVNKAFDGDISLNEIDRGKYGVDIEGSDVMSIGGAGANRFLGTLNSPVVVNAQGSFGNMDSVVGNEILYPLDDGQTVPAYIYSSARSIVIERNHIEGHVTNTTSAITLASGFSASVQNNDIDVQLAGASPATNWLLVGSNFINIRVFNNGNAGISQSPALFNSGAGSLYWYNSIVRQEIQHGNNVASGDSGFPMNSLGEADNDVVQQGTSLLIFGCNTDGLSANTLGLEVYCQNQAMTFPATGSGNPLLFDNFYAQPVFATGLNLSVKASSISGGQICGQFADAASLVSTPTCQTLTASPLWYTLKSNVTIATRAGASIYASASDVKLLQGKISN